MKVLLVNPVGEWGGAEKIFFLVSQIFQKTGFELYVLLGSRGILYEKLRNLNFNISIMDFPDLSENSIVIAGRRFQLPHHLLKNLRKIKILSKKFWDYLRILKPDIIYLNNLRSLVLYYETVRTYGKPCEAVVIWHEHGYQRSIIRQLILDKIYLKFVDAVICVSKHLANKHLKDVQQKLYVVHNGIPDELNAIEKENVRYEYNNNKVLIIHPAFITYLKGQHLALKAVDLLVKRGVRNFEIWFFGEPRSKQDHKYFKKLKQFVRSKNLEKQVSFKGFSANIIDEMLKADIVVSTSVEDDSFPTILLEASMAGKPAVTTDAGGSGEIVKNGETGFVVKKDKRELASALCELIQNKELRDVFSKNARDRFLKEFSILAFEKRFLETLESILRR
jgi:glycosyltransferase involved in cell wall biosynthesis